MIMKKLSKKHPKSSQIHEKVDLGGALGGGGGALWGFLSYLEKSAFFVILERFWGPF
jgi:hypothetical protein